MELLGGIVGTRVGGRRRCIRRFAVVDERADDATGGTARKYPGQSGMGCVGAPEACPVGRVGGGFRTGHEGGAQLRGSGAQFLHGANGVPVHDAAGSDDGKPGVQGQLSHQHGSAQVFVGRERHTGFGIEAAPVAAGLDALRDDGIQSSRFYPTGLIQVGGAGQQADAGFLQGLQLVGRWQPEMKAHHRRTGFQQDVQHPVVIHEAGIDLDQSGGRYHVQTGIERCQMVQPGRIAGRIGGGRPMAENVDVEGPVGEGTGGLDHPARVFRRAGTGTQTTQSPRVADGSRQFGCGHAGHGGLQDGQGQAQAFHQGMGVVVAHKCVSCAAGLPAVVVGFPVADPHRGWCLLPTNTPFTGCAFYRRM